MVYLFVQCVHDRFRGDEDGGDHHQYVAKGCFGTIEVVNPVKGVPFLSNVGVPVEGPIFKGVQVVRPVIYHVCNCFRRFQVLHFAVDRYVAVCDPYLSTYPYQVVKRSLADNLVGGLSYRHVVVCCVVVTVVFTRLVLHDYLHVNDNCLNVSYVTYRFEDGVRWLWIRRVVGGRQVRPLVSPVPNFPVVP